MTEGIHQAHRGVEKCQLWARSCVFWPNINKDIEATVQKCEICQESQNKQAKKTLEPHEVPTRAWEVVRTDLFSWNGDEYILVWRLLQVSNYQEKPHGQSTGNTIVNLTKFVFSEQGVPEVIVSGNGPHYDCKSYKEFSKEWGLHHFMWSPRYLQSNGFNEPQLQTVKHTLDKSGQDPHMSLLCLRSTPVDSQLQSPAELLNQCKLHSNPPFWVGNLITDKDKINQWLTQRQQQMKYYHDRSATDLSPLTAGQPVHIQDQAPKKWLPGPINCTRPKPYSYEA